MKMPNSANEGMVRKVEVMASATPATRSLRNTSTPSETPITTSMASDMATTMAWPMASSTTWSQLRERYSRKPPIYHISCSSRLWLQLIVPSPEESPMSRGGSEDQPSKADRSSAVLLTSCPAL